MTRQGFSGATEAVRLVQGMPAWKPGKQSVQAVNVRYNLPINFSESGPVSRNYSAHKVQLGLAVK